MRKMIFTSLIGCCLLLPLLLVASGSAKTDNSLQTIKNANKLVIGTNAEYPPFENVNPVNSSLEGFDIEIGEIIGRELDVEIEWKNVGWDGILLGLDTGLYDIIISAMTITEEREQQCDFTRWYYQSYQAVMVKNATTTITGLNSLNSSTVKIGFQEGTTSDIYVTDNLQAAQPFGYDEITHAVEALSTGAIDVVLGDHATLLYSMNQAPNTYKILEVFSPEDFGIACKSGSTTLKDAINVVLNDLLGSNVSMPEASEEYNTIYAKWFYDVSPYDLQSASTVDGFPVSILLAVIPVAVFTINKKLRKRV